jgi:hypothetical protein
MQLWLQGQNLGPLPQHSVFRMKPVKYTLVDFDCKKDCVIVSYLYLGFLSVS